MALASANGKRLTTGYRRVPFRAVVLSENLKYTDFILFSKEMLRFVRSQRLKGSV
jgi:hypothetical protein